MINHIFYAAWFFLAAGIANITPIFAVKVSFLKNWNQPIDGDLKLGGKRLLGDSKTWRGLLTGTLVGGIIGGLQFYIHPLTHSVGLGIYAGLAMGLGALLGDLVESFFKRQLDIAPGVSWFPFDQLDYIIGGVLLVTPVLHPTINTILWVYVVWFAIHLIAVWIGHKLGLREKPL